MPWKAKEVIARCIKWNSIKLKGFCRAKKKDKREEWENEKERGRDENAYRMEDSLSALCLTI